MNTLSQLNWQQWIKENDLVIWGQTQAEPVTLTRHLMQHAHTLAKFQVFLGISNYATCSVEHTKFVDFSSYCGAGSNRHLAKQNLLEIYPLHYSTLSQHLKPDVVLIQVSAPNDQGLYSFGLGQDYLADVLKSAKTIIAEVNHTLPWVYSEDYLTADQFDFMIESDYQHDTELDKTISEVNQKIAQNVAALIPNGATLQIGIGILPEAVLDALNQHQDLGIHSGIISDAVGKLIQKNVINNTKKPIDIGKTITGLINGSTELQQLCHLNSSIQLRPTSYTHHPDILAKIHNLFAVNSAIEVDLTGQVNAEIANGVYVGAIGGALDFIRAANRAAQGASIIALPASGKNFTRIVAQLNGPVSTPRCDIGIVVTEYGIADLRGCSLKQRVRKMIAIAAPEYQNQLHLAAQQSGLI